MPPGPHPHIGGFRFAIQILIIFLDGLEVGLAHAFNFLQSLLQMAGHTRYVHRLNLLLLVLNIYRSLNIHQVTILIIVNRLNRILVILVIVQIVIQMRLVTH